MGSQRLNTNSHHQASTGRETCLRENPPLSHTQFFTSFHLKAVIFGVAFPQDAVKWLPLGERVSLSSALSPEHAICRFDFFGGEERFSDMPHRSKHVR
jgi:hypothetical protein